MAEGFLPPVVVHLLADIKEFQAKMGEAKGEMDALSAKGASTGAVLAKGFGLAALGVGGLAAGIAGIGIASAMKYEEAMAKVGGQLGLTEEQTKKLGDQFMKTSRGSEFSAVELATAYQGVAGQVANLAGGSDVATASTDVLRASMELAVAKGIDLTNAVAGVVGAMRTFQMPTSEAADAMAILYNTSSATGIGVEQLNSTFARMNAAVVGVKPPAEDIAGLLVDLGKHGVTGSRAVNSVAGAFTKMLDPAFQTKAQLAGLSLTTYDANGNFVGIRNIIDQLGPQFAKMTPEVQQTTIKMMGLGSAGEKLIPTLTAGSAAFDQSTTAVKDHKKATQAADAASNTFHGNLKKVKAAASDAATALGNILMPYATKALEWFAGPGANGLRKFINGLSGKGHSTHWAHQLGEDMRSFGHGTKRAFELIKEGWDKVPGPLKPIILGALGGAAIGGKVAGGPGAVVGGAAGAAGALGAHKTPSKGGSGWDSAIEVIKSGMSAAGWVTGTKELDWLGHKAWDWITGGGTPAGAAERPKGGGGRGGAGGGASTAAMTSILTAINSNTLSSAQTLQTSDQRLERHGGHLEKIDTMATFTSQHTRETNSHLMKIQANTAKRDKVNIKVRLV